MVSNHSISNLLSDHYLILFNINCHKPHTCTKTIYIRQLKKLDHSIFFDNFQSLYSKNLHNSSIDAFNSAICTTLNSLAPLKTKIVSSKPHYPWYTNELSYYKRSLRLSEKHWRKNISDTRFYDIFILKGKSYQSLITSTKKIYYTNAIRLAKNDYRAIYKITDMLLNRTKTKLLTSDQPSILVTKFDEFFHSKLMNIVSTLRVSPVTQPDIPANRFNKFIYPSPIYILNLITSTKYASPLDHIPIQLLILLAPKLNNHITRIITESLQSGRVPDSMKIDMIRPILKKQNLDVS